MTAKQIDHVEEQLIRFIDRVVDKAEEATQAEIAALPGVASALADIYQL